MIFVRRYTSGSIALANLSAQIENLERCRHENPAFDDLSMLSDLLYVRADVLGAATDLDLAELIGNEASAHAPDTATALYIRARLAARGHRFAEARALLDRASAAGHPAQQTDGQRAMLLQVAGRFGDALAIRQRFARDNPGIDTLGSLATLLAEMDDWVGAERCFAAALEADDSASPFPCSQLLFEWSVCAMRRRDLVRAENILSELTRLLPQHRGARALYAELRAARDRVA